MFSLICNLQIKCLNNLVSILFVSQFQPFTFKIMGKKKKEKKKLGKMPFFGYLLIFLQALTKMISQTWRSCRQPLQLTLLRWRSRCSGNLENSLRLSPHRRLGSARSRFDAIIIFIARSPRDSYLTCCSQSRQGRVR